MPTFKEIAGNDPRLRQLAIVIPIFIVGPLVFSIVKQPDNWLQAYVQAMLYAFSFPLLVLGGMLFSRWRKLARLAENGVRIDAIVEKTWRNREGHFGMTRFTLNGLPHSIKVRIPAAFIYTVADGAGMVLLVDPAKPENAAVLDVRSAVRR